MGDLVTFSVESYMDVAIIGFDKNNNELLVCNPGQLFTFVFYYDSEVWHTIDRVYDVFIENYPMLQGLDSSGIWNISQEATDGQVSVLYITREQGLEFDNIYKRMNRCNVNVRCDVTPGSFLGFYISG